MFDKNDEVNVFINNEWASGTILNKVLYIDIITGNDMSHVYDVILKDGSVLTSVIESEIKNV